MPFAEHEGIFAIAVNLASGATVQRTLHAVLLMNYALYVVAGAVADAESRDSAAATIALKRG
jgi:hypothetical protein